MFKQKEFNSKAQKARRLKFDLNYASKMDPKELIRRYNNATRHLKKLKLVILEWMQVKFLP